MAKTEGVVPFWGIILTRTKLPMRRIPSDPVSGTLWFRVSLILSGPFSGSVWFYLTQCPGQSDSIWPIVRVSRIIRSAPVSRSVWFSLTQFQGQSGSIGASFWVSIIISRYQVSLNGLASVDHLSESIQPMNRHCLSGGVRKVYRERESVFLFPVFDKHRKTEEANKGISKTKWWKVLKNKGCNPIYPL